MYDLRSTLIQKPWQTFKVMAERVRDLRWPECYRTDLLHDSRMLKEDRVTRFLVWEVRPTGTWLVRLDGHAASKGLLRHLLDSRETDRALYLIDREKGEVRFLGLGDEGREAAKRTIPEWREGRDEGIEL